MRQRFAPKANRPKTPRTLIGRLVALVSLLTFLSGGSALAYPEYNPKLATIVIDASSGQILSAINSDAQRYPASLTKMMTIYLAFEALRDHRITEDELVPISPHAASQEPSKLGLVPGSRITVHQALLGLVTRSANDAASALGELMGGTEDHFAQMMTLRAHALGMTNTVFRNASGLPDPDQVTTAHDMALLARHLIMDFPDQYSLFSTPAFFWHGQMIANHDNLLKSYPGADGLKTGYTDAAGHNLVTSAVRSNVRLIGVVLGASSNPDRDLKMAAMLDEGYTQLDVPLPSTVLAQNTHHSGRFPSLIATAEAATLPYPAAPSQSDPGGWAIQLGRFPTSGSALHVADRAARALSGRPRIERSWLRGRPFYRAEVAGLRESSATAYCRHHLACTVTPADRIASR